MQRTLTALTLALALGASSAVAQEAPTLGLGDKAPALKIGQWVKGEPVNELGNGHVTVVDFWATWCGPCIASIPHMSETQAKYADDKVNIIGVSIWEGAPSRVVPFVTGRDENDVEGDEMVYRVAMDAVPALPEGVQENSPEARENASRGAMATSWMGAAGRNGIPSVFIVDRTGTIAWIGHPMGGMDEALAEIVAGTWDIEAAKRAAAEEAVAAERAAAEAAKVRGVMTQIMAKLEAGETAAAFELANTHVDGVLANDPGALNALAWMIVDPESPLAEQDLELALKAAKRANELTEGKHPSVLDTLARVMFARGDLEHAIALQKSAVEASGGNEGLAATLAEYEAALRKREDASGMVPLAR